MRKRRCSSLASFVTGFALISLYGVGCDGDRCAGVVNRCYDEEALRCSGDHDAVLICQENIDSCLVWTHSQDCGAHQQCVAEGDTMTCRCLDACEAIGYERCQEEVIQTCTQDDDGCLFWSPGFDCGDTGQICTVAGHAASCITVCEDECAPAGITQCDGTIIQTCEESEDECNYWVDGIDCDASGQLCDDDTESARCVPACSDECLTQGDVQCSEDGLSLETCTLMDTGCLDWVVTSCGGGRHCSDAGPVADCYDDCTDACSQGTSQCDGTQIEMCRMQANGCLDWEAETDCADSSQICSDTSGIAGCYDPCTDAAGCTETGDSFCVGTVIRTCEMQPDGCLDIVAGTDCSSSSQICSDISGTAGCYDPCTHEAGCTAHGDTFCSDDVIQTCSMQPDGCLDAVAGTDCSDSSQICSDVSGTAGCYPPCTDQAGCIAEGDSFCSDSVIHTCEMQPDGCLDDITGTDCSHSSQNCSDTSGTAGCYDPCANEAGCTAQGDSFCSAEVIQNCSMQSDGCLDAIAGTDCSETENPFCDMVDGTATCVPCIDECQEGDTQCAGRMVQNCVQDTEGDPCWYWEDYYDCSPWYCVVDGGAAPCENGSGESCDSIFFVDSFPFTFVGTDLVGEFDDDVDFSTLGNCGTSNEADAIFGVELDQYEAISMVEVGDLDAVFRVVDTCDDSDPAAACLLYEDEAETWAPFVAPEPGYYYVILEAGTSTGSTGPYDFTIYLLPPEDNCDGDGDDDEDGLTDCYDPDCWSDSACILRLGPWEPFDVANQNNLEGCQITFSPQTGWPFGYEFETECPCGGPDWTPRGSGTASLELTSLENDASHEYSFVHFPTFPFFSESHTSVFVNSNGHITFGSGDSQTPTTADEFFALPRIAGLAVDLDPLMGTPVTIDDFDEMLVVTYQDIPEYGGDGMFSVQIVLQDDGTIETRFLRVESGDEMGMTGVSNGVSNDTPEPVRFNTLPRIPRPGDVIFTEFMPDPDWVENDFDGEYLELFNTRSEAVDLSCCFVHDSDNAGNPYHTYYFSEAADPIIIPPHQHAVFIRNTNPDENGDVYDAYLLGGGIDLRNSSPENFGLYCEEEPIDLVEWEAFSSWPDGNPKADSVQLSPFAYDASMNGSQVFWCSSTKSYNDIDHGTPGLLNTELCAEAVYSENFETDPEWGLPPSGNGSYWHWGTPDYGTFGHGPESCAQGNYCYGTNLQGTYDADLLFDGGYLESPDYSLVGIPGVLVLSFLAWVDMEPYLDAATVLVRSAPGGWDVLPVILQPYNFDDTTLTNPSGEVFDSWTGSIQSEWVRVSADLSAYAGQTIDLRWTIHTDSVNDGIFAGFYLDDFMILAY